MKKLKLEGYLSENDSVASILTGSGFKYTKAFEKHSLSAYECKLENLETFIGENF